MVIWDEKLGPPSRHTAEGQARLDFRYEETCSAEAGSALSQCDCRDPIATIAVAITRCIDSHETPPVAIG